MPRRSRRDLLFALPVLLAIAIVGYIALTDGGGTSGGSTVAAGSVTPLRWELASEIADLAQEQGAPSGLAGCVGERAVVSSTARMLTRLREDHEYRQTRADVVSGECRRSYVGPASTPDPGPITIDPQASPNTFAAAVDEICAVDFNNALAREAEIKSAATTSGWSRDRTLSLEEYAWAGSEADTARYVANLGRPPSSGGTVERWRENVAERARLFGEMGDALKHGDEARAARIDARIMTLKEEADRLGNSFGLHICTSN